ncbi:unnamed protein product [Closterium sp. Naga37s-1]|nr:unnamed protein product [Closterium sp. Naga37s-1]
MIPPRPSGQPLSIPHTPPHTPGPGHNSKGTTIVGGRVGHNSTVQGALDGGRGGGGFGILSLNCLLLLQGHSSTVQQALESLVVWDSVFFHRTALCDNSTVQGALESLVVWDSVFFHRIALCGYEFEQAYAFFPLLPSLMRLLATATPSTFALVGLLLSNAAFVAAAFYLFRLTECVLSDTRLALLSSLFFCLTPASTFYSAIYSESLFALLSFAAMWRVVSGRWFSASLLIALSAAARSNGVLHSGFFLFSLLQVHAP